MVPLREGIVVDSVGGNDVRVENVDLEEWWERIRTMDPLEEKASWSMEQGAKSCSPLHPLLQELSWFYGVSVESMFRF